MFGVFSLFLLGLVIGSFLNVAGLRWNSGIGLGGRSLCPSCNKRLLWWELLPVVSFLFLRGRCVGCKTRISWQYPLVELWTGVIFASLFWLINPTDLLSVVYYLLVIMTFSIYVVIVIYDLRHRIIPDEFVFMSLLPALTSALLVGGRDLLDWSAGPIIFLFFGVIWLVSRGRAVGLGDAKLGLSIGVLLGAAQGFSAVVMAFWVGTASILLYMLAARVSALSANAKRLTMKSEIPFGPFMVVGAWVAFLFGLDLLYVSLL